MGAGEEDMRDLLLQQFEMATLEALRPLDWRNIRATSAPRDGQAFPNRPSSVAQVRARDSA
jgi:hypothetical protein